MTAEKNTNEESLDERLDQRSLSVQGSVDDSTVVVGDHNTISYYTNVFGAFNSEQFPAQPSQQLSRDEYRWRQVLVQNVKHYWIEGVLERSLHNQVLIELGLEDRSQAVALPIGAAEEFVEDNGRPFPVGTQATDIFDGLGAGRTLLILGEPGAGKTTMLLKLTKTLIARIGDDFSQPIPVVLNLSSWAKTRKPIAEWLVQDLSETFQVSKSLGVTWIKEEQLTLCLDGLDEVAVEHRDDCVQALNQFLQVHGRTEVVVCSRVRDYEALSERLRVKCAIYVQPLTEQQIDQYIAQADERLSALNAVLNYSPEIKAFAASPLILSVMSLAYQGHSFNALSNVDSAKEFRQQLFDTYIERMFLRRGKMHYYTDQQATHWLVWMAQRMVETSQTVFFIEKIQPSWLQSNIQRLRYRLESILIFGLTVGLLFGLFYWLIGWFLIGVLIRGLTEGVIKALYFGLRDGLFWGLLFGLISAFLGDINPVETLKWSWKGTKRAFHSATIYGQKIGLVIFLIGLLGALIIELNGGNIVPSIYESDFRLLDEPVLTIFWLLLVGPVAGSFYWYTSGLLFGLVYGLIGGLIGPGVHKNKPNQGIWQSALNACLFALPSWLTVCVIFGLIKQSTYGLFYGLPVGLFFGLMGGWSACLRHFSLRLMLYRMGYISWNYTRFLDYAAERLFLQKVGGGYIFIHRMLLEHFAQMELEQRYSK